MPEKPAILLQPIVPAGRCDPVAQSEIAMPLPGAGKRAAEVADFRYI